jgi:uncharacterized membrane protein
MAPLVVLVTVTVFTRLAAQLGIAALKNWPAAMRVGLGAMFGFTSAAHFNSMRADLIRMVPPAVPAPGLMVTFTGLCEVLGAIGLLVPRTQRLAAAALVWLLVAVLPANIYAAMSGLTLGGSPVTPLAPRIALQGLFIAAVWWSGLRRSRDLAIR